MKRFLLILALWLAIAAGAVAQTAIKPTGEGTQEDPYQIATLDNLYWLSKTQYWDGRYYLQTADIDATSTKDWDGGKGFPPIGALTQSFISTYDGNGHTITGLYINRPSEEYVGLWRKTKDAAIKGLTLTNPNVIGKNYVGCLAGYTSNTPIASCKVVNGTVTGTSYIGGLAGEASSSQVSLCSFGGQVKGSPTTTKAPVGGLAGTVSVGSTLSYCYTTGSVTGVNNVANGGTGGLVGVLFSPVKVQNCYSTADVEGSVNVGGLVGFSLSNSTIDRCFSAGNVSGTSNLGGLVGFFSNLGTVTNSYYDSEVSKKSDTGKGAPKTTAEMKAQGTFAGWGFYGEPVNGTDNRWMFIPTKDNTTTTLNYPCFAPQCTDNITFTSSLTNNKISAHLSLKVAGDVYIDWGNGVLEKRAISSTDPSIPSEVRQNPFTAGSTVKILGNGITGFNCAEQGVSSLDVSGCKQLQNLYCNNNSLTAIDISKNPALKKVVVSYNQLKELTTSNNPLLEEVNIEFNPGVSLDFSKNPALTYLHCAKNGLSTLNVSANANLKTLVVNDNKFSLPTLPPAGDLGQYVYAPQAMLKAPASNGIVDLSSQLKATSANGEQTTSYTWYKAGTDVMLEKNTDYTETAGVFTFLTTPASPVYCIMTNKAFSEFTGTKAFRTEDITVERNSPLAYSFTQGNVGAITEFRMRCSSEGPCFIDWGNGVLVEGVQHSTLSNYNGSATAGSTVKVYAKDVVELISTATDIRSVDVSASPNLQKLSISGANIATLDLTGSQNLTSLGCTSSNLKELKVSSPKLVELSCYANNLKELDISSCTALTTLHCYQNQLQALNLSSNTALKDFNGTNNLLTTLKLNASLALEKLSCADNLLTELVFPDTQTLKYIYANNNKLDFNTLPKVKSYYYKNYQYAPQQPIAPTVTNGVVDLRSQQKVTDADGKEYPTTYTWYKSGTNDELTKDVDYTETAGVFTFISPVTDGVYCVMTNPAFDGFVRSSSGNIFRSEEVKVKATPIIRWENPTDITYGNMLKPAGSNAEGTFSYTPSLTPPLNVGDNQTFTIKFMPTFPNNVEEVTKTVTVNVKKKQLTVIGSTHTITKGDAIPTPTITYRGFANGEDERVLDIKPTLTNVPTAQSNAGEYVIGVTGGSDNNYKFVYSEGKITINKITPTINWANPSSISYGTALGNTQLNATATAEGTFAYSPAADTKLDAGQHELKVTFTPADAVNYNSTEQTVTLTVEKATPTIAWNPPSSTSYGTPLGAAQLSATANTEGTFTYSPAADTKLAAGQHELKVTFTPADAINHTGAAKTVSIVVEKATPTITWATPAAITYGTPLGAAQLNATADAEGAFTYSPAADTKLDAGQHKLKVTFTPADAANYNSVEATVSLTVEKAMPTITWNTPTSITYGTKLSDKQQNATADIEGAFTYAPAEGTTLAAGKHDLKVTFTPTDAANYNNVEATVSLTVDKATPTIAWNTPSPITYGTSLGAAQLSTTADAEGAFTYSPAAKTLLNAGEDQTLSATFTPIDKVNYNEVTKTVAISVAKAPLTVTASNYTITKGEKIPALEVTYKGFVNGEDESVLDAKPTLTTSATNTSPVGKYTVVAAGGAASNYELTYVDGEIDILDKRIPTVTWAEPAAITYGSALNTELFNATASYSNAAVEGTLSYTTNGHSLKAGDVLNAGTHSLKVTFTPTDGDYYISVEKTVSITVNRAPLTATANSYTIVKGEPIPALGVTYKGFVNSEDESVLDAKPTATTTASAASPVGKYTVVAAGGTASNYELTFVDGEIDILDKRIPTVTWAEPAAITYGSALNTELFNATASYSNAAVEGTLSYTTNGHSLKAGDVLNAGTHSLKVTFTPTDGDYYISVEKTVSITVNRAPLTATANSYTIVKGEPIPALGVTYKGFVNSEDESVLDAKPTATTTASAASPVGKYTVVAAGGTASNYELTFVDGEIDILDKRIPTVTWAEPNGITYGTPLNDAQLNATASFNNAAVEGTLSYTTKGNAIKAGDILTAGTHSLKVTFTPTDGDRYIGVEKTVSITVSKATLTATATSYSIHEGEAIPALGITYSGFVNGDTEAVLEAKPTATTTATATSPTGVYAITADGGAAANYALTYVAGKLTISNPIEVASLQAPQAGCEGDKLSLAYTLTSGKPTEYQIVFDAKALAAGFSNSGYAALPAGNGTVSISIPSRVADGAYTASLQLRDGYGNISEPTAFQVTVNVSADIIVPKFGSVVLIDNHEGRFAGYQWYKNGSAVGGATNQFYKDPNGLSGTYYAQLKTATGQTVNTCSKVLSIKKSASASVSVYPNPARAGQELTVKLSGFGDEELLGAVLTVYSTQGAPVRTLRKVEQENRITLSGSNGVYMGRIVTADGQVLTFKVVLAN
ncbi:MBG domain-containing protein [uncultured Acetobacteroides sp.]|uniref:MBG domain-containing protein n=1 Tax=uncultured Acetobacteroides sp. TaxID=1760811 RepID=UPI0029F4B725|nr:MBG domain-containing protein [uncultured Acetobacteroides sp.]